MSSSLPFLSSCTCLSLYTNEKTMPSSPPLPFSLSLSIGESFRELVDMYLLTLTLYTSTESSFLKKLRSDPPPYFSSYKEPPGDLEIERLKGEFMLNKKGNLNTTIMHRGLQLPPETLFPSKSTLA